MTGGPVFVAGLERSGTSLAYALLASHPDIAMTRRTNLWRYVYRQYGDLADRRNLDRCLAVMERYKRLRVLELDFGALRRDFLAGPPTYSHLFELVGRQVANRLGKSRWGDKSLHTERFAELIVDAYPAARILHMVRDPRDRYASVHARWGRRLGGVGAATAEWLTSVELAMDNERRFPSSCLTVRYEDLASDPSQTLQRICLFIDAPWREEMLEMGGARSFREAGGNSSYGEREGGTISTDSIGKFHSALPPSHVDFIQRRAGAAMELLGYAVEELPAPWHAYRLLHAMESLRYHAWNGREAVQRRRRGKGVPGYRLVETGAP
jgi:hypothetical protein